MNDDVVQLARAVSRRALVAKSSEAQVDVLSRRVAQLEAQLADQKEKNIALVADVSTKGRDMEQLMRSLVSERNVAVSHAEALERQILVRRTLQNAHTQTDPGASGPHAAGTHSADLVPSSASIFALAVVEAMQLQPRQRVLRGQPHVDVCYAGWWISVPTTASSSSVASALSALQPNSSTLRYIALVSGGRVDGPFAVESQSPAHKLAEASACGRACVVLQHRRTGEEVCVVDSAVVAGNRVYAAISADGESDIGGVATTWCSEADIGRDFLTFHVVTVPVRDVRIRVPGVSPRTAVACLVRVDPPSAKDALQVKFQQDDDVHTFGDDGGAYWMHDAGALQLRAPTPGDGALIGVLFCGCARVNSLSVFQPDGTPLDVEFQLDGRSGFGNTLRVSPLHTSTQSSQTLHATAAPAQLGAPPKELLVELRQFDAELESCELAALSRFFAALDERFALQLEYTSRAHSLVLESFTAAVRQHVFVRSAEWVEMAIATYAERATATGSTVFEAVRHTARRARQADSLCCAGLEWMEQRSDDLLATTRGRALAVLDMLPAVASGIPCAADAAFIEEDAFSVAAMRGVELCGMMMHEGVERMALVARLFADASRRWNLDAHARLSDAESTVDALRQQLGDLPATVTIGVGGGRAQSHSQRAFVLAAVDTARRVGAEAAFAELEEGHHNLLISNDRLSLALSSKLLELSAASDRAGALELELDALAARLASSDAREEELTQRLDSYTSEASSLNQRLHDAKTALAHLQATVHTQRAQHDAELRTRDDRIATLTADVDRLARESIEAREHTSSIVSLASVAPSETSAAANDSSGRYRAAAAPTQNRARRTTQVASPRPSALKRCSSRGI